jgi:hypothetical protein
MGDGNRISKLCKDFKLKSTCISNCCSDGSKNDVNINDSPKHHKPHHKPHHSRRSHHSKEHRKEEPKEEPKQEPVG